MLERQLHDHSDSDARARGRRPAKVPDEVCVVVDQPTEESSSGRAARSGPRPAPIRPGGGPQWTHGQRARWGRVRAEGEGRATV